MQNNPVVLITWIHQIVIIKEKWNGDSWKMIQYLHGSCPGQV
jgi:hypothetical protein